MSIRWTADTAEKIAKRHHVTREEVEEAVFSNPDRVRWVADRLHGRRLEVLGRTDAGRRLVVFLDPLEDADGAWRCRTAWQR